MGKLPPQEQTFNGEFKGYAAGMVQSAVPSGFVNVVASTSPNDFRIDFNSTTNTLSANLTVRDVQGRDEATSAYTIGFGDDSESPSNKSAYIDNLHYAAIENGNTTVSNRYGFGDNEDYYRNYDKSSATAYLVSGDQLNVTKFFPDTFTADDKRLRVPEMGCLGRASEFWRQSHGKQSVPDPIRR